jgi:hypothetical protein
MGQKTVYVNALQNEELKPPRHKRREYFFLQNLSADAIYYSEDTIATPENGIEIGAGQFIELDLRSGGVPQNHVWISGAALSPTQQRVLVKED